MSRERLSPSALDWDIADSAGGWSGTSSALLMLVAGLYWTTNWLSAGLPPLTVLASQRMHRSRVYRSISERSNLEAPAHE
jgi:hypothetical protein